MPELIFLLFVGGFIALLIADFWWTRECQRAVDEWNAERPADDPRKASVY